MYGVARPVLLLIRYHYVFREDVEYPKLSYVLYASFIIIEPLILIVVGGMDAIPRLQYKWRAGLAAILALHFSKLSIQYQFLTEREEDFEVYIESTGSEISFHSLLANAAGMIAVFLWKQAIDVIRNRDRCICITYRPYLEWVDMTDTSNVTAVDDQISESVEDGKMVETEMIEAKDVDAKEELSDVLCCS